MTTNIETETELNLVVKQQTRLLLAESLSNILADTYTLYLKTHKFYWYATGSLLDAIHSLTEQQYKEMAPAIDEIAQCIRAIGFTAPNSHNEFMQLASVAQTQGIPDADEMILHLVRGNETIISLGKKIVKQAREARDIAAENLIAQRIAIHQKNVSMLRSLIGSVKRKI